jgi:hypothetical protein
MYNQYFNILSKEEYSICKNIIDNSYWEYGHKSTPDSNKKFWKIKKLQDQCFFNDLFMQKIKKLTNENLEVHRIYANGHSFGQDGEWHTDSDNDNDWTFIYYFNEGDEKLIGGTYFRDENDNITDIASPIFNSGIFFKANIPHKGTSPLLEFNDLRITIAFKLSKHKSNKTLF